MAIKYQIHEDGMFPRILCDTCGHAILVSEGNVFWNYAGDTAFAHRGVCGRALDKQGLRLSMGLDVFIADLLHNIKATPSVLKSADHARSVLGATTSRAKADTADRQ
jgi:hypothetical protein